MSRELTLKKEALCKAVYVLTGAYRANRKEIGALTEDILIALGRQNAARDYPETGRRGRRPQSLP
jgi:hypothetical protein